MLAMSFIQTRHLFCRFSWWYQKQVRRNACPRRYYRIKGLQLRDALFCWTDRRMPTLTLPWTRLPKTWRNKIESAELTVITIQQNWSAAKPKVYFAAKNGTGQFPRPQGNGRKNYVAIDTGEHLRPEVTL